MHKGWQVLICLGVWPLLSGAGIYRYTDAQGQVHYTSHPPSNSQATELEYSTTPTTRFESNPSTPSGPTASATDNPDIRYQSVSILGVEEGAALRVNDGSLNIQVNTEPALYPEHKIRLLLDGAPVLSPSTEGSFSLSNLERGAHTLQAEVLNAQGKSLQRSASIGFSLQRTSLNNPARRSAP